MSGAASSHRVASTQELATNFIDYKQNDGKKKLLLYCFITALCVKMNIFFIGTYLSLKYTPNNDMKVIFS